MQPYPRTFATVLIALSLLVAGLSQAHAFSLTGRYEGTVACDSTTSGRGWSWGRDIEVLIAQDADNLQLELRYVDVSELGHEYALYRGKAVTSADGSVVSGYFASCGASFPAQELVRMFPTSPAEQNFSFAADSIWVSDEVPNLPGLTVQSCRWALRRTSPEAGALRPCPPPQ